jgi:hypothetical protein
VSPERRHSRNADIAGSAVIAENGLIVCGRKRFRVSFSAIRAPRSAALQELERDRATDSRSQSLVAVRQLPDPAKRLVCSNLKIGTERLVTPVPKAQSPWRGPRMPRCLGVMTMSDKPVAG